MKFMVSALIVLAFSGCSFFQSSPVVCSVAGTMSTLVSSEISTQLSCTGITAIKSDIDAQIAKLNVCTQVAAQAPAPTPAPGVVGTKAISIGSVICQPVVDALTAGALTQVPAAWNCSGAGGPITDTLKGQLMTACLKAIP